MRVLRAIAPQCRGDARRGETNMNTNLGFGFSGHLFGEGQRRFEYGKQVGEVDVRSVRKRVEGGGQGRGGVLAAGDDDDGVCCDADKGIL
jgi:hypothetical protein